MANAPQRIIEHALVDGIGPISAKRLMALPEVEWGLLRQAITDAWRSKPRRELARCLMCSGGVFIKARAFKSLRLPMFAHFKGANASCPWFTGDAANPNDVRAGQYQGRQESIPHRLLCNQIATLAEADPNCVSAEVARYLPPTENTHGRFPDVLVTYASGQQVAFEIQLSNTFQTEISDRCQHYQREGVPLIWVLLGAEIASGELPQSFRDVVLRHRGNAFALDESAVEASILRKRLVLTCFLRNPHGGFDGGRLVDIGDLTYPVAGCPYLEDRVTPELLARSEEARLPWRTALRARGDNHGWSSLNSDAFTSANDDLCRRVPELRRWQETNAQGRWLFCNFVTVLFSTLCAAAGKFRNYASRQDNIHALLNSKLPSEAMLPFAQIMHAVLHRTALSPLLDGSVGTHLARALEKGDGNFALEAEGVWEAVHALLPELFDPALRLQLETLGELPTWAQSDRANLAFQFS